MYDLKDDHLLVKVEIANHSTIWIFDHMAKALTAGFNKVEILCAVQDRMMTNDVTITFSWWPILFKNGHNYKVSQLLVARVMAKQ